ncbi:hypothetical protein ACTU3I_02105 [Microbacterium sp. RD1]|uniref:hypothetical protein n=1 Tax=Microbacterium sp. RD1 TaxID=3457313 RepID=UPI003FA5A54B
MPTAPSSSARIVAAGIPLAVHASDAAWNGVLVGMQYTGTQTVYLVAPDAGGSPVWLADHEITRMAPAVTYRPQ